MSQTRVGILVLAMVLSLTACHEGLKTDDAGLLAAARTGHSGTVRDLIAAGANVDVKDKQGNTALIEAARNGHDEVVRTLLAAGADVRIKNDEGKTALMLALQGGHDETAQALRQP